MYVPPSALTADQRRAVCQHGPLIVRASAGSGKTRVLVERYVRLLLDGYDVRRIVAMTFTRKAAAEMLDRTARRLDQLFEAAQQPDQLLYLRTLRERLIGAHISTFHSYCSSLLRRFPIEAGIEPTFGELSAADTVRLMRDAIRITVEQWLADHRRNDVADLLMVFGSYQTLENALNQVLSDAQHIESLADSSEPDEIVLRVGSALRAIADDQLSLWRRLLWQANEQSLPPKIKKSPPLEEVERILDQLQQSVHTIGRFDADAPWRSILREALGIFHERSSDSLRSPWKYLANATELLRSTQRCRVLQHAIDTTQEIEIQAWNAVVLLQRLAREALLWMDREKNLLAAFGPDDLQRRAVKLLDVSTVRERLVREIQHVLVDEFQDTDPIEYDLLQKLIPLPHVVEGVPELFIVGDPKQSIYGFRGADVRVFERARNDIVAAGGAGADVRLQTSFRMTPALVAVVNTVMRSIMPESTRGYDVGYEELCTARPEEICPTSAVALLISASDDEQTDEATLVARHIVHCTAAEPLQVWDEHIVGDDGVRGGFRPVQYRDIVLLARKFSTFEPYVRALRQAGLPFRIESGRGFYRTQEILDVTAFLRLVHNRHDDIALATFLRSPFVGLDDSQLTLIATTPPTHGSLYERMVSFVEHDGNSAIADARALLDELLAIAIRMPPTALMRMLLRRTPWYSRVAVSPRRQQIEANIEKLLDLARQFEQRGFRNLLDFVEELDRLRTVADTEAEAAVISDDNVITLMTIHAAKGLEFPVVYLVGTDQQSGGRSSQLLAADPIGLAIKTTRNGEATVTGAIAHDILQQREQAEERRLLYVALTRAKDHLFIAGTLHTSSNAKASIQPRGYLGTIGAALGIEWDALLGMRSISIPAWVRTDAGNPEVKQLTVTVEIIHQMPAQTAPQVLHRRTAGSILTEPIIGAIEGEIFSASQLALFARSPEEFYRVYRCGLPARSDDMRRSLPLLEQPEQIVGTFVGRIVHRMLEILLPAQRWEETDILTTLERVLHEHQCIEMHALKNRVVSDVRSTLNFLRTHNLLTRVSSISLERPMIIPLGRHFLLGVPDVVLATGRGWEVWDWKTDRRDGIAMDELIGRYRRQLEVYALLVSYLHPKQTSYTVRLIATRPPVEMATLTLGQEDIQRVKCEIEETINQIEQLTLAT